MYLTNTPGSNFTARPAEDKLPHDASVFVGSLPSNIDQGDLTRMLMEHLSEHTQIRNIKVVRDSKGGVCAFVQCESAPSANALIQTLHSSVPKPFLGRILRYEPARAFRSLIISYRTPIQFISPPGADTNSASQICNEIELDLPVAMRLWKQRNSKFHNILYNSEAIQSEENHSRMAGGPIVDSVLFLHPLKFDHETLHRLVSYFGPLERFGLLECPRPDDVDIESPTINNQADSYPEPHRAPRSTAMNPSCWEVKWEHRDDCVSALMTLKRVPHLTVTWAHQPASLNQMSRLNHHQDFVHRSWVHHTPPRPSISQTSGPRGFLSPQAVNSLTEGRRNIASPEPCMGINEDQKISYNASYQCDVGGQETDADKDPKASQGHFNPLPPSASRVREDDFDDRIAKSESRHTLTEFPDESPEREVSIEEFPDCGGQELVVPRTPTLDSSTITPLTPGSHFPLTPTSPGAEMPQTLFHKASDAMGAPMSFGSHEYGRDIDPTTLFVGGLDISGPGGWDEDKVRRFFSRFGGLESVKFVSPQNAAAAFAFVKFDNAESPARAVSEEHNRVYEGRAIRVQLRDCNPQKSNWKYGRGRGRPHQYHFNALRRYNYRSASGLEESRVPLLTKNGERATFQHSQATQAFQLSSMADALPATDRTSTNDSTSSPLEKSSSSSELPAGDKYREWYDNVESAARTPEPSSITTSTSTASISFSGSPYSYSVPNGPYLPPPPWMQPYSPHGPYQMPYYSGYTMYPSTVPQQGHSTLSTPPASDIGSPSTPVQPHWPGVGMYASYIPYPAAPGPQGQVVPPQINGQAPVVPTGFIQNEQGTLIAVYQPEVLDQYLAGSGRSPASINHPKSGQAPDAAEMPPPSFTSPVARTKGPSFPQFPSQKRDNRRPFHMASSPFHHRQTVDRRGSHHGFNSSRQPRPFEGGQPNRGHVHPAQLQGATPGDWHGWNNSR